MLIQEYLISIGHDSNPVVTDYIYSNNGNNQGISVNTDGQCPLHLAAAASQTGVAALLCQQFPESVDRRDRHGQTPLHLACTSQTIPAMNHLLQTGTKPRPRMPEETIETLIAHGADVRAKDAQGNTCLHNASAWGNLKAVRALIQAGADPLCKNKAGWTPEYYSITVQAEVYYRNLVAEWEKRKVEEELRANERRAKGGGGVRLVPQETDSDEDESVHSRSRASIAKSQHTIESEAGLGISVGHVDAWK